MGVWLDNIDDALAKFKQSRGFKTRKVLKTKVQAPMISLCLGIERLCLEVMLHRLGDIPERPGSSRDAFLDFCGLGAKG
jgi:hypothetical protein